MALVITAAGCAGSTSPGPDDVVAAAASPAVAASDMTDGGARETPTVPALAPTPSAAPLRAEEQSVVNGQDSGNGIVADADGASPGGAEVGVVPTAVEAFADSDLPAARIGVEALDSDVGPERVPVSLVIDDIDVVDADVIAVGVNSDETLEVPPADEVGWYKFGPSPGDEGSAVLAAHIAYDGVDGVFRRLADLDVGAVVIVGYDDGSRERFRIESVTDYVKEELPASLFARSGASRLALITCGGSFNPELRSYDSNTVAVAVPI